MRRVLQILLSAAVAALVFAHAGTALAAGGNYRFDGGNAFERTQVREALKASSFNWNLVKAQITIHIQHEYAHQVDFFLLTQVNRSELQPLLGAKAWCWDTSGLGHADYGCERFASTLAWTYWQNADNCMKPTSPQDESGGMAPTKFKALLSLLIGTT